MPAQRSHSLAPSLPPSVSRALIADLALVVGGRLAAESLLSTATPRHLATASVDELERLLPKSKALRLFRVLRFARAALTPERPAKLDDRTSVWRLLYPELLDLDVERFWAIPVDARCQPFAVTCVAQGTPSAVDVRPADIFAVAVRHRATALIVAHNHPSGSLEPSPEDLALTDRLIDAGLLLGIDLLDHVIVTTSASTSMREEFDLRDRPWTSERERTSARAAIARFDSYDESNIRMTDRQRDQLLGHLQLLLDRVRSLRDEAGRLPESEKEVPDLLSAVEDYDLLDDPTVLEAHSFLRGMAAGMGLSDVRDLAGYARDRLTALPEPPNWVALLKATGHAAELLGETEDATAIEATRVLTQALEAWRDAPWELNRTRELGDCPRSDATSLEGRR